MYTMSITCRKIEFVKGLQLAARLGTVDLMKLDLQNFEDSRCGLEA